MIIRNLRAEKLLQSLMSNLKKKFFLLALLCYATSSIAQIDRDNTKETDLFQYQPEESKEKKFEPESTQGVDIQAQTMTLFGTLEDIASSFPTYSVIPGKAKHNFNQMPRDKDVMVKKYWNGKDVSVKKFQTNLELGRIETDSKTIKIVCRDHSYVDGDRVKLYVNEVVVRRSITLQGGYYVINIDLKDGFNRIDIEALNQGSSGPNTAEFAVFDERGQMLVSREWNILTGYIATLVVLRN